MKAMYLVRYAALLASITACSSDSASKAAAVPQQVAQGVSNSVSATNNTIAKQVLPIINGFWVQATYLDAIARSQSPFQAQNTLKEVTEMQINSTALRQDSMEVGLNLGNHEGGQFSIYFRPARNPQSLPISHRNYEHPENYYELGYTVRQTDTVLHLNEYTARHQLASSVAYRRVRLPKKLAAQEAGTNTGLQYEVNRILMSGRYAGYDSSGAAVQVQFMPDGSVAGMPQFKQYYVGTDFAAGPENNLDQLVFDLYTSQQRNFTYRFHKDTLRIYALQTDSTHTELSPARLHYTLVRR